MQAEDDVAATMTLVSGQQQVDHPRALRMTRVTVGGDETSGKVRLDSGGLAHE